MLWASQLGRLARTLLGSSVPVMLVFSLLTFTAQIHGSDLRTVLVVRVIDNATGVGLPAFVVLKGPENLARQMSGLGIETFQVLPGIYTITVSVSGYGSQKDNKTVLGGVQNRIRFQLSRVSVQNPPAPTPPPALSPPPPPPAPAMGSVAGRITNASTGQGIAGATVSIGSLWSGMTDASGSFRSPQLAAGAHHVSASGAGYESVHQSVLVTAGQTAPANFALQPAMSSGQDCLWSDPRTWGGNIPSASSNVAIPTASCSTVTLDGDANVRSITVNAAGILKASTVKDTSLTLWAGNFLVYGTADWRTTKNAVVRWTGINESGFVGGHTHVPMDTDPGLWVQDNGKLLVEGKPKLSWTRLDGTAERGSSNITLAQDPDGWQIGDELAIAPTLPPTVVGHYDAYDYPRIAYIAGRDVTLDRPLAYDHPAVRVLPNKTLTAEVMNFTRNVVFTGEPGKRAHIIFNMSHEPQTLKYFEARYMGPQRPKDSSGNVAAVLGRYGLHFHKMGDASRGTLVEGVVMRDLGNKAFVPHGSYGITLDYTIAHNCYVACYWWDPVRAGQSTPVWANLSKDILWKRAIASRATFIAAFRGFRISGFFLADGINARLEDSVAVGIQGNADASGVHWPEGGSTEADRYGNPFKVPTGVWAVERFVSHNNKVDGFFTWQNTSNIHAFDGLIAYHNGGFGWDHGAYKNPYQLKNFVFYGNRKGSVGQRAMGGDQIHEGNVHDAAGGDHCLVYLEHVGAGVPVRRNEVYRNCRVAAIYVSPDDAKEKPGMGLIENPRFENVGTEFWFDDLAHPDTYLIVRDTVLGNFTLRHKSYPGGTLVAKWNAKKLVGSAGVEPRTQARIQFPELRAFLLRLKDKVSEFFRMPNAMVMRIGPFSAAR